MEANLGERLTVAIDTGWPHRSLWQHPFGTILRVTYVDWDAGITEAMSPGYIDTTPLGRAEAYKAWTSNPNRSINVNFKFRAQGLNGTIPDQVINEEVLLPARFLDALKYPVYNPQQDVSYAPPPVILRIGTLLTARCVLTGGDPQWIFDPMDPDSLLPHGADFNATFEVVRAFKRDLSYFPSGQSGGPMSGDWQ